MKHATQIYPCSEVSTGSELYYLCEVGRYLKNYGETLSLEGVIINKELSKSKFWSYFCYSIENGYIVNVGVPQSEVSINLELVDMSKFFTLDLSKPETSPAFKEKTNQVWSFSLEGSSSSDEVHNINLLNGMTRSQSWVSLVAYVSVERFLTGFPNQLIMSFSNTVTYQRMAVADIYLLEEETSALNGWVTINYLDRTTCDYESWIYDKQDKGYMLKPVHSDDKKALLKKMGLRVGDPVFLYKRAKSGRSGESNNRVRDIEECKLAVIESVTKSGLSFTVLGKANTRLGKQKEFEACCAETRSMYKSKNYLKSYTSRINFSWLDIGVDKLLFDEDYFFLDISQADTVSLWVTNGVQEDYLTLSCQDGAYWVLKDGEIPFNEDSYKKRYTKDGITAYDRYMLGK